MYSILRFIVKNAKNINIRVFHNTKSKEKNYKVITLKNNIIMTKNCIKVTIQKQEHGNTSIKY